MRGNPEAQIGLLQSQTNEFKTRFKTLRGRPDEKALKTLRGNPDEKAQIGQYMNLRLCFKTLKGSPRKSSNKTIPVSGKFKTRFQTNLRRVLKL